MFRSRAGWRNTGAYYPGYYGYGTRLGRLGGYGGYGGGYGQVETGTLLLAALLI